MLQRIFSVEFLARHEKLQFPATIYTVMIWLHSYLYYKYMYLNPLVIHVKDFQAAIGRERACNPHSASLDGEILIVTKNSKTFDEQTSIGNVCTWFYSDLLPH